MSKAAPDPRFATPWDRKPQQRVCDAEGCAAAGEFRAPRSRDNLNDYYWFCLDHVRAYNAGWNYCEGMDAAAIDRLRRTDSVWGKPTWPLNDRVSGNYTARMDGLNSAWDRFFNDMGESAAPKSSPLPTAEGKALAELELDRPVSRADLKKQYLGLVKKLHPDANGGNKDAEERLKRINQAYSLLKNSSFIKETLQESGMNP